jgi:hypothetical protein
MRLEGLGQLNDQMTSLGIEPATFRLVEYAMLPHFNLLAITFWPTVCRSRALKKALYIFICKNESNIFDSLI